MIKLKNIKILLQRILFFSVLLFFAEMVCFSQTPKTQSDSTKISQKKTESGEADQNQNKTQTQTQSQVQNKNQGNSQKAANGKVVKQVKSAKPDMSKAKGARPNIVRPSGSSIPKGAGKPGGVKRMGRR